ncbi:MAG TPA: dUTP diphosphatase [Ignavibacteria bacterium]|nr:dUTP diphosphatase [Bacteroidota bacterium]HRE11675.1 dUTP diphosphatase [Ignavibacteria bacterium]HRF66057.1 dUTP diphosphatase [Ignavibacteria bacterium]HRJ02897.1 dUTP diphosphatase [Ignavibacteria bacterium]HRJ86190.1 dUTP diphosphatase [Ignavibacteria bacterium]
MILKIRKINETLNNPLPAYATEHAAGMDITSASQNEITIKPQSTELIPTNLILEIPIGFEAQIRPRSGLALKHNIGIINSPGTIDADYRGELKILLTNFGKEPYAVKFGERIAQMVICRVEHVKVELSHQLSETLRSDGGFGSTGK